MASSLKYVQSTGKRDLAQYKRRTVYEKETLLGGDLCHSIFHYACCCLFHVRESVRRESARERERARKRAGESGGERERDREVEGARESV
jgi:hypothetical protein